MINEKGKVFMDEKVSLVISFDIFLLIWAVALFLIAYLMFYKYLVQEKRCTAKTTGVVKGYTMLSYGGENAGVHLPIVHYYVDNKEYKVVGPKYKSYVVKSNIGPLSDNSAIYQGNSQVLIINRSSNSFVNIRTNFMEEIFPVGTEVDVFYDPKKPKLAYVLRYCNNKWCFWLTFLTGIAVVMFMIIDLLILFTL